MALGITQDDVEVSRKADLADSLKALAEMINSTGIVVIVHGCDLSHGQRVRDAIRQNVELQDEIYCYQSKQKDNSYDVSILPAEGYSRVKHEFDLRDKEYVNWGDMMSPSNVIWRTHALIPRGRLKFMTQPVRQGWMNNFSLDSNLNHPKLEVKHTRRMRIITGEYTYVMAEPIRTKFALEHRGMTFIYPYTRCDELTNSLLWSVTGRF
jgi:hypothetical protein